MELRPVPSARVEDIGEDLRRADDLGEVVVKRCETEAHQVGRAKMLFYLWSLLAAIVLFFVTIALVLFLAVHVTMVAVSGFWRRMREMIVGHAAEPAPSEESS